jgi:hypothetical protein
MRSRDPLWKHQHKAGGHKGRSGNHELLFVGEKGHQQKAACREKQKAVSRPRQTGGS